MQKILKKSCNSADKRSKGESPSGKYRKGRKGEMGLAASQSRFLILTSRQSDVEARLMSLSNQQLALSSEATALSQKYANAMAQETVTFGGQAINYSTLMQPNIDGDQYFFTNAIGSVLLSPSKALQMGLTDATGKGTDFKKLYPYKENFLEKMVPNYVAPAGTETSEEIKQNSGYRYDDNVLNDAVVYVQSSTVLGLQGYDSSTTLEYAMGTQQGQKSSLVNIYTLDKYQYTDANVHSVVNSFVYDATDAMAQAMLNALGDSDAVTAAPDYAMQKTQEYYQKTNIKPEEGKIIDLAADNNNQAFNDTTIHVSTTDYTVTTTTGVTTGKDGQTSMSVTTYTGKEVFLNTAQLSAVFLNYFDAAMYRQIAAATADDVTASSQLYEQADLIELLNNGKNGTPLANRQDKATHSDVIGGYNKQAILDKNSSLNGTTGIFGDTVTSDTTTGDSTSKAYKDYYTGLYKALCNGGWTTNSSLTDSSFLSKQMQYGNVVLNKMTGTSSKMLSLDDSSSGLGLKDDEDALDKASADYEVEKNRMDYKTAIIENEMSTLNTELEAIQNEKDSVKTIINEHMDKFTLFQNA